MDEKAECRLTTSLLHARKFTVTSENVEITILACDNAAGTTLPPMVIFDGQRFNPKWSQGEIPNTLYGMSQKGWADQELFWY